MEQNDFSDIAPYEGQTFEEAIDRLRQYPQLLQNFTDIISRRSRFVNTFKAFYAKRQLQSLLNSVHSYDDFQKKITCDLFLNLIENSSIDNFTFDGILQLGDDRPRIYVSTHRDIVLDTALLDLALYRSGRTMCEMVVGSNLLVNQFTADMFKVNGGITINRGESTDARSETLKLSRYITHVVEDKNESVWIAQRSGRSKDGLDDTSSAVVKMLFLASREQGLDFPSFLKRVSVVPVAISYQYDPCDVSKSQEVIRKLKNEGCYNVYVKKKYEDILDVVRGLRLYKGNVHIQVGTPLSPEITNPNDAVKEIDRQIHMNYRLWDTNYFAWDYLNGTNEFESHYRDMNTKAFVNKYKHFNDDVVKLVYTQYANPVQSMLNETKK